MQKSVFISGSRSIHELPNSALERMQSIINKELNVIIGDAIGVDREAQQFFKDKDYKNVTIYCGANPRHNLGNWPVNHTILMEGASKSKTYSERDRSLAKDASFGLVIWDCLSQGSIMNVYRLLSMGKPVVIINQKGETATFTQFERWPILFQAFNQKLKKDLSIRIGLEEKIMQKEAREWRGMTDV